MPTAKNQGFYYYGRKDIGYWAHLAVSAMIGQELINEMCPSCVAPKCSFLEPVPAHNKVFTRLCWNVHTFVQCSDFLIVFFKKEGLSMGTTELPEAASVHFCPLRYMGTACSPGLYLAAWDPGDRDQGCIFSGVLFLPQGPTLEARHTPPPRSLHGIGID